MVASLMFAATSDDVEQARREVAAQIAFYASAKTYAPLLERIGFAAEGEAIRDALAARLEAMVAAVSDRMIDALAVAGTPQTSGTAASLRGGARSRDPVRPSFHLPPERLLESALGLIDRPLLLSPAPVRRHSTDRNLQRCSTR